MYTHTHIYIYTHLQLYIYIYTVIYRWNPKSWEKIWKDPKSVPVPFQLATQPFGQGRWQPWKKTMRQRCRPSSTLLTKSAPWHHKKTLKKHWKISVFPPRQPPGGVEESRAAAMGSRALQANPQLGAGHRDLSAKPGGADGQSGNRVPRAPGAAHRRFLPNIFNQRSQT